MVCVLCIRDWENSFALNIRIQALPCVYMRAEDALCAGHVLGNERISVSACCTVRNTTLNIRAKKSVHQITACPKRSAARYVFFFQINQTGLFWAERDEEGTFWNFVARLKFVHEPE
jgi:hypothetical protein